MSSASKSITPEEKEELQSLRAEPRWVDKKETYGEVYNSGAVYESMRGPGHYKDPTMQRIHVLSQKLNASGAKRRPGGWGRRRKTRRRQTRRRQTRRRQTRRN